MSEVIIFFLNNVTVILISLILLSNFFVVFSCVHSDSKRGQRQRANISIW